MRAMIIYASKNNMPFETVLDIVIYEGLKIINDDIHRKNATV